MAATGDWDRLKEWVSAQVTCFARERPRYVHYATALREVLQRACEERGVVAVTQARAKALASFAEKALRKADKYPDPARQLTDLCGARVVAYTQADAEAVGAFIRENFRVDEANSQDVRTRLKAEEFGYRAMHYVVQLRRDAPFVSAILDELRARDHTNYWRQIGERRAEIQVCTLLQHAWAAIYQDRVYKTELAIPERFRRDLARVAALLEGADREFGRVVATLDGYREQYSAYMKPAEIRQEIEKLELVRACDAGNAGLAHRLARLALAIEDWEKAARTLTPFRASGRAPLLRDLGLAKWHWQLGGREELKEAVRLAPGDADAWRLLGDTWLTEDRRQALRCYEQALRAQPAAPQVLASYLDCRIPHVGNVDFIPLMYPTLEAAIARCNELASMRVHVPGGFYDAARFALLLGRPYDSLAAYARGVGCTGGLAPIERAIASLEELAPPILNSLPRMPELAALEWALEAVRRFLLLARAVKARQLASPAAEEARSLLLPLVSANLQGIPRPILIVAGGCAPELQSEMERYRGGLEAALEDFEGTLVGGGTRQGISGIVGDVAARRGTALRCLAYRPLELPADASPHEAYQVHPITQVPGRPLRKPLFTALEPIQAWIDLVAAGVDPAEVKLLVVNGGEISAFECRMALALGATAGIVESSGRGATELQADASWWGPPRLLFLPNDPMALRAFVHPGTARLTPQQLEEAGRAVHQKFLEENRYRGLDPAMRPWEKLSEDLRNSNRHQVAYAEHALRKVGYGIRQATGKITMPAFSRKEIETMAELEHGRWVVERLASGWNYGPRRDPANKISPWLVPWSELPDAVKGYDRNAVANSPAVLAQAGLEVYPLRRPARKNRKAR